MDSSSPGPLRGLNARDVLCRALSPARITGGAGETWEPPPVAELAAQFPGYELLELIGRGGMGAVYRARQLSLARLAHPHIVGIYDWCRKCRGLPRRWPGAGIDPCAGWRVRLAVRAFQKRRRHECRGTCANRPT